MATPYDANNTGGTLPLPKIHIPTWFKIRPSNRNDARLDLDLLDELNLLHPTISGTLKDWLYGDNLNYISEYIGALQENNLYAHHYIDGIFLYVIDNNQVIRYGFQVNYEGWINYDASTSSYDPITINGEVAKKEISKEWFFDVSTNYYVPSSSTDVRDILGQIWDYIKQGDFEHFDTVEEVYLFWESLFNDDLWPEEEDIEDIIIENSEAKIALNNEELIFYGPSPMGYIENMVVNLGGSHIENYPYLAIKDSTTSDGVYMTSKLPSSNGNGGISDRILMLTINISIDYNNETFNYIIYINNESHSQTYSFSWGQNYSSEKIVSVIRLANEIWPDVLANIVPSNTVSSVEEAYTLIDNNWPSLNDFWGIITNEEYLEEKTLSSEHFVEPIKTFPITIEQGSKDIVTIGNTPPKLGSIIAYSHPTEFLPDTNSSHVLYFKNAELKSFNFAVQNNTVIDRIEKLYRYAGLETNLTTELQDIDVDSKNMKIKEGTADVPENSQILFLTEGSVVTSV